MSIGAIFFLSRHTRVEGWLTVTDGTYSLFRDEYKLPLIPVEIAAHAAVWGDHALPLLLLLGLSTRLSALALLGRRGFIRVEARRLDRDGMQGGFCSKYRDICKETNAADRPSQVIARHDEQIRASLRMTLVIQLCVYPDARPTHLSLAGLLLYLLGRGAGTLLLGWLLRIR